MNRPRAPYVDVRIERPQTLEVLDGLWASGLMTIDFFPPASGPEIELTFGAFIPGETPKPADFEVFVKGMVEQAIRREGGRVLAVRSRDPDDPDPATGVS